MKFFLDMANLDEIRQPASLSVLEGVTANPSLAAKEQKPFRESILFKHPLTDREASLKDWAKAREVPGEITAPEAMRKGAR